MPDQYFLPANWVEAHKVLSGPVAQKLKALAFAQNAVVLEIRLASDVKTDRQRRYYHGVILKSIAQQAKVNGQKYELETWKEYFRAKYLGFKVETTKNPITGKKVRRRVRVSTEDLGVKGYNELIERVTAEAATDLGVEFPADRLIDPETGEVLQ